MTRSASSRSWFMPRASYAFTITNSASSIAGAAREAPRQFLECVEGIPRRLRVALGEVLAGELAEQAHVLVEMHQAFQVISVIGAGMTGVQLQEPVDGGDRRGGFALLEVGIGALDRRLLRVGAVGEG